MERKMHRGVPSHTTALATTSVSLVELPEDTLQHLMLLCRPVELLALGACCTALRRSAEVAPLWRDKLHQRHAKVLRALFDGEAPRPPPGRSWKQHYFEFETDWLALARERTGRLLLRMRVESSRPIDSTSNWDAAIRDSFFGMLALLRHTPDADPPPATEPAGERACYGVFDATAFLELHPGSEYLLLRAAREDDATAAFENAAHSGYARELLAAMLLPGLDDLPCDGALGRPGSNAALLPGSRMGALLALPRLLFGAACCLPTVNALLVGCRKLAQLLERACLVPT